jgi:hypothetical protein
VTSYANINFVLFRYEIYKKHTSVQRKLGLLFAIHGFPVYQMNANVLSFEKTVIALIGFSICQGGCRMQGQVPLCSHLFILTVYLLLSYAGYTVHAFVGGTLISKEFFQMLESSEYHSIIGAVSVDKKSRQENESQTHAWTLARRCSSTARGPELSNPWLYRYR